jgi:hypothetical protein
MLIFDSFTIAGIVISLILAIGVVLAASGKGQH